jgi:hypothetical protein
MNDLVASMVQDDPTKRPTIINLVMNRFSHIRQDLTSRKLRARIPDRDEGTFKCIAVYILHFCRHFQ